MKVRPGHRLPNGAAAAACSMRLTGPDRLSLTCPDINPRSFRRTAR